MTESERRALRLRIAQIPPEDRSGIERQILEAIIREERLNHPEYHPEPNFEIQTLTPPRRL